MSHVNGNDIDDLFRRASEKYPLKVGIGDWPSVAADLEKDPSLVLPPISDEGDRRRRKRFLWLLLLLPLGGLGYLTYTGKGGTTASTEGTVVKTVSTTTPTVTTTTPTGGAATPTGETTVSNHPTIITTEKASSREKRALNGSVTGGNSANPAFSGAESGNRISDAHTTGTHSRSGLTKNNRSNTAADPTTVSSNTNTDGLVNGTDRTIGIVAAEGGARGKGGSTTAKDGSTANAGGSTVAAAGGSTVAAAGVPDPRYAGLLTQRAAVGGGVALTVNVQGRMGATATVAGKNNLQKLSQKKQTSFYIGLLASPDLSTVKMQSIKGVGTTFSFLLGYNINRNWAIETGLSLDRKKYFTEGEYFSKEHLNLYPGYSLLNVDGLCNMWELPINVRYNFGQGNSKMRWFATAGMSTYFMSKENYSYQTENMATGAVGGFSHTFAHPTQYPFSVINLSMGYEQSLGKIGNLRLEPYLRVPLAGIGTGSLPIMSAGLNIGITRRIW